MALDLKYEPIEVVSTEGMTEDVWLEYRRAGFGGSDCAAVMGQSPWATARDLFYDKCGLQPLSDEEDNWVAKEVGHLLEDLVAKIFSKQTGLRVFQKKIMYRHPLFPFMQADLDYFVEMPDGSLAILECKTSSYHNKEKWEGNSVPINYELQGRHYMAVMNINTVFYACLFGNNEGEFVKRRIDRDLDYEENIILNEKELWENYIMAGVEPPYTEKPDLVLKSIARHYGHADTSADAVILDPPYAAAILEYLKKKDELAKISKQKTALEKEIKSIYVPIVDKLGASCTGICKSGKEEFTVVYKPSYSQKIDKDKLEIKYPAVYSELVTCTEKRNFSITRKEIT